MVQNLKIISDTREKSEAFGSSLLLANSPMSPKIVNGSFAAIFDADEFLAKTYAGVRIAVSSISFHIKKLIQVLFLLLILLLFFSLKIESKFTSNASPSTWYTHVWYVWLGCLICSSGIYYPMECTIKDLIYREAILIGFPYGPRFSWFGGQWPCTWQK